MLLFVCLIVSVYFNLKAGETVLSYEEFFEDTISDFEETLEFAEKLRKSDMVSDNEEFKKLRSLIVVLHDTLINYVNARERFKGSTKEEVK